VALTPAPWSPTPNTTVAGQTLDEIVAAVVGPSRSSGSFPGRGTERLFGEVVMPSAPLTFWSTMPRDVPATLDEFPSGGQADDGDARPGPLHLSHCDSRDA